MAAQVLLESDIEKGRKLLEQLRANKVPFRAAFWHLDPDESRYSLFIATPIVDEVGPLTAYGIIGVAMSAIKPSERVFTDAAKAISQSEPSLPA